MDETASQILKSARTAAGLSQRELAHRARTAQSVVARTELGENSPSWDTMLRLVRASGHSLGVTLERVPKVDRSQLEDVGRILRMTPEQRLNEVAQVSRFIRSLNRHKVRFVLIGALAARLHGFPRLTADAGITPADAGITPADDLVNLERLAEALKDMHAKVYTEALPEGLAFDCSAATLARAALWNLATDAGRIDIAFKPAGTTGYDDLAAGAAKFEAYGVTFLAASVADIIRSKKAAKRPKDREDVAILKAMQRRSSGS